MTPTPARLRGALLGALIFLLLAACSSQAGDAAQFSELDAAGFDRALKAARGRVLLVCFWATQCPACRIELPELEKLQAAFPPEKLTVLTVALDDGVEPVRAFFGQKGPGLAVRLGREDLARAFAVRYIPKLVIFNPAGEEAFNQSGVYPYPMLERVVKKLLGGA
jgi:thiol-disulfide isomerase/thioredoxin